MQHKHNKLIKSRVSLFNFKLLTVGRNLFPSTPILKKYSAADASLGTCREALQILEKESHKKDLKPSCQNTDLVKKNNTDFEL